MTFPGRRLLTAVVVPLLLTSLAACTGSDAGSTDPAEAMATAQKLFDETTGVQLELSAGKLPAGVDGLVDANGVGTHAPAFKGTVDLLVNDLSLQVPVVAVDGLVYAKLPFTTKYSEIDPADYGAPDPARLMQPGAGLSAWMSEVTGLEKGDDVREGDTVLTTYSGTLTGKSVVKAIPSADSAADYPVTFRVDQEGRLRSIEVSGPFYGEAGDVAYTVELSDYGTDEDITRP